MTNKYGVRIKKRNVGIVAVCLVVSTLQMISCFFWLFGFVYSKKKNPDTGEWEVGVSVLSEAMEEDEETNCVGLVGAELLLAVFQALFSLVTVHQALQMREVLNRTKNPSFKSSEWIKPISALCLGIYVYFAWGTAVNRRCQRAGRPRDWQLLKERYGASEAGAFMQRMDLSYNGADNEFLSVWVPYQHHFYPIFLIFDTVFGLMLWRDMNKLAKAFAGGAAAATNKTVRTFQKFFRFQAQMIIIGCAFAVFIFVLQFMLKVEALSLLACIFCVCMYVTYAMRRVPMLMLYTQFPPFVKKFDMDLGDSAGAVQVAPTPPATVKS